MPNNQLTHLYIFLGDDYPPVPLPEGDEVEIVLYNGESIYKQPMSLTQHNKVQIALQNQKYT